MLKLPELTPDKLEFVLLCFEGPDQYAMAGGLGVRMKELALELARQGYPTHEIFIGDPDLPAKESPHENLTLYRWGQWLSSHFRGGVYQGEEAKLVDWNEQLPCFVVSRLVRPAADRGAMVAVLAEEWHTAYSACELSDLLWREHLRDRAVILWNANNIFGFDRVDWGRLDYCSQITTVSRYMKHIMWGRGVNPLVIPNGIPEERITDADPQLAKRLRAGFADRELLFKIGRWSPDKRWNMAVETLAAERSLGHEVTMVTRGGVEPHAAEVLANARSRGLDVRDVRPPRELHQALAYFAAQPRADIYNVITFMSDELISLFYSAADAVLANSGHEPFGLVGLEVMAAGGVAFVGSTGEDYAVPYLNAVVLDSEDPTEICIALQFLRDHPEVRARMRADAVETARSFTWANIVTDTLLGKLKYVSLRQNAADAPAPKVAEAKDSAETASSGSVGADAAAYGGESAGRRVSVRPRSRRASRTKDAGTGDRPTTS